MLRIKSTVYTTVRNSPIEEVKSANDGMDESCANRTSDHRTLNLSPIANLCIDRYFCLFMSIINIKNC